MTKPVRALAALLVVLAALLTSGCSARTPMTAAVVDGDRIAQADVDRATDAVVERQKGVTRGEVAPTVATWLVVGKILEKVQPQVGTLTEQEYRTGLDAAMRQMQPDEKALYSDPRLEKVTRAMFGYRLLAKKVGEDKLTTAFNAVPVELNPRYGTWPIRSDAVAGDGSLSQLWLPTGR